jgi:putative oxidoreductase
MPNSRLQDIGILLLRVGLGLIMLYYGSQKMLGIFGGAGFEATIRGFQERNGIPPVLGTLAIFAEFAGALGIIVGLLTRVAAFGLVCTMGTALFFNASRPNLAVEMFTEGSIQSAGQVFFPAALLFGYLAILLIGPGAFSLDAKVFGSKKSKKSSNSTG